jgi:hypothetical protein
MAKYLWIISLLALAFMATPGFAYLKVTPNYVNLSSQANLGSNVTMLNLTFNLTDSTIVNLTQIAFSFNTTSGYTGNQTNLSVCIYNTNLSSPVGCNSSWVTSDNIIVNVGLDVSNTTNLNLLATYSIPFNTPNPLNMGLDIASNNSINLNTTSVIVNDTSFPIASNHTTVRVVSASASLSPSYVDTNAENQTFRYFIYQTSGDSFNNASIIIPPGFTLIDVINYTIIWSNNNNSTFRGCTPYCNKTGNNLTIIDAAGIKNLTVFFTANTNSIPLNSTAFNSTIDGTNVQGINTSVLGSINATVLNLISVNNISTSKNSAYVNGSDYWEFSLSVNTSATVNGKIQFRMNDWNSPSKGKNMSVFDGTRYYAFLWDDTAFANATNKINVTNNYNITNGVVLNASSGVNYVLRLRMIIPAMIQSSATPIASDWWTTYSILFRPDA